MTDTRAKTWSVRRRLTRTVLGLVVGGWFATIAVASIFLEKEMSEAFDEELTAVAQATALSLDDDDDAPIPLAVAAGQGNRTRDSDERFLRVLRPGDPVPQEPWAPLTSDGFHDVPGWRVLRLSAEHAVVEVAHSSRWRHEEFLEASGILFVLMAPMLAALVLGLNRQLGQALAPIERLAADFSGRTSQDLSRVSTEALPAELVPLAQGLNGYMARVDDMRRAERQFVANAAHELRTPIASIRARLDGAQEPETVASLRLLDDLTRRIERLLQLSRTEAGVGLGRGPADAVQIVRLLIDEIARRSDRAIRFDDGDHETFLVPVDPDALAILIRNLIENAVEHGSGPVQVRLNAEGALTVLNPTSGTDFVEAPFGKRAGSTGAGLGLSIVQALGAAMNARIEKRIEGGQASVVLHLPTAG